MPSQAFAVARDTQQSAAPGMRIAVIGCGAVTERYHLPALARIIDPQDLILVDINEPRARELGGKFQCANVIGDYRSIIGNADAAVVALPHTMHATPCVDLLNAGIHVLVEKPMATSSADCERINSAARRSGAVLAVGLMRRFLHSARWTAALIQSGLLGEIQSFDIREGDLYGWRAASDSFVRRSSAGGGVLMDTGAHVLDLLLWWLGDVASLEYADDYCGGVESECRLRAVLASGARGEVHLSRTRKLRNTAIIRGSKGEIEVAPGLNAVVRATPEGLLKHSFEDLTPESFGLQRIVDAFPAQFTDWIESIRNGREPFVGGAEGSRSVELIERCYDGRRRLSLPWNVKLPASGKFPVHGAASKDTNRVFVTGASGFIGGRLVERLLLEQQCTPRVLVRDYSSAARLTPYNVELAQGDLADAEVLEECVRGCDSVFHCAYDAKNPERNLQGALAIANACARHGVRRLVYLSSFSAYEPFPSGTLDESSSTTSPASKYAQDKRRIEAELLRLHETAELPVVILQPTIVYGPFSKPWTLRPVEQMLRGRIGIPEGGTCNPVYVDDVVDAMLAAAESDAATGQRYLISGEEHLPWLDFFRAYERILNVRAVVVKPETELRRLRDDSQRSALDRVLMNPREAISSLVPNPVRGLIKRALGARKWEAIRQRSPGPLEVSEEMAICLYKAKAVVSIDKARRELKYAPKVGFAEGMARTAEFIEWAQLCRTVES